MKYSLTILALAAAATAQKIDACDGKAQPCIEDAIAEYGECEAGDEACACENMSEIQPLAASCVIEACGGAADAASVIEEVEAYCANLPEDGGDGGDEEPTDGGEEPAPTDGGEEPAPTDGGEEPAPTDGGEEPAPTGGESAAPSSDCGTPTDGAEDPAEPAPTEGAPGNGTSPSEPPTAGARALAPMGALLVGLFAFAL